MAIQKFVQGEDLKKLIDEKVIDIFGVKQVLRKKGIFPVCVTADALSELVYRVIFGSDTMTQVHSIMNDEQNNIKSTMVVIQPKATYADNEFFLELCDEFGKLQRIPNTKYKLHNVQNNTSSITLKYVFEKPQKGRVSLAESKPVTLDVCITPINNEQYKVSIHHEGSTESKQFVSLLEEMVKGEPTQQVFSIKRIALKSLTKSHKIDFFDHFGSRKHKEWTLIDITNVTVNIATLEMDDDENNQNSQEYSENEPTGKLTGISSAIITGAGLRNNDFVKECMVQGFVFSSMRFKFNHVTLPIKIELDVNFKQTDLKINIIKS